MRYDAVDQLMNSYVGRKGYGCQFGYGVEWVFWLNLFCSTLLAMLGRIGAPEGSGTRILE
jgi:hypothetical protein